MMDLELAEQSVGDLLGKEWLETNGIGGYASSSLCGANTRKYHGLLVASLNPPTGRRVLVSKIEERVGAHGEFHDLSVNQYPGTLHPQGYRFLKSFRRRPMATWRYAGKGWALEKTVFMVPQSNTTVVTYCNTGGEGIDLELHPLFGDKDYHATSRENHFDFYYEGEARGMKIHAYPDSPPLFLSWSGGDFREHRAWYKNVELPMEFYRGQDFVEDYYRIGYLSTHLKKGQQVSLLMTTDRQMHGKRASALKKKALESDGQLPDEQRGSAFFRDLLVSGRQFLVDRAATRSKTLIAGYHWFTDWGRDTMIAMRGLTIATGDQVASKSILSTFLKHVSQGMIPNRFPDYESQEVEYNTIDATLWLFVVLYEYAEKFNDRSLIDEHIGTLEEILRQHLEGTRFRIRVTGEGFLSGGEPGWQLTWMDARIDGHVVTPRMGCPVEINALWYNALCIFEKYCYGCNKAIYQKVLETRKAFSKNFKTYFLNEKGYLNDVVIPDQYTDDSFRPNQVYALSLPFPLLNNREKKAVFTQIREHLLTDFGLRSLSAAHPDFIGTYGGNQWNRDLAYHQGTVWPFLLMEFWEAFLRLHNGSLEARKTVVNALSPLKKHFYQENCIHGISEIFDGAHPDEGRGCIHQAWSVAALVKLYADHKLYELEIQ